MALRDEQDEMERFEEEHDLFEKFSFLVDKGQGLLRIDKYLFSKIENVSRNKIQNAAKAGNILVNGQPVKQNYRVKPADEISVLVPEEPRDQRIIPENIPLDIVFEDDYLMIINKSPGMVVHPAYGNYNGTLVNALAWYLGKGRDQKDGESLPYLVHRIDKDTSGLMVVTKDELTQSFLARQFADHTIDRRYLALVWGDFEEDSGVVEGHVGRNLKDRRVMDVFPDGRYGKHAITHYRVLERFGYTTLIECRLETGRTHQIRAHMQHIRHPIFNDATYGGDQVLRGTTFTKYKQFVMNCFKMIPRQALHAASIGFLHPVSGQRMLFESELPDDMATAIERWRHYSLHRKLEEE